MRKEKLLVAMTFLSFAVENEAVLYSHEIWTPTKLLGWFTTFLPIKVTPFELACILMLLVCRKGKATVAKPLVRAIHMSAAALVFAILYGFVRGGATFPIYTQTHVWLFTLVFALTVIKVFSSVDDFYHLGSAIVYAALWRSAWAVVFYLKVRSRWDMPAYMTTHEDSMLFVIALLILVSRALEFRTKQARRMLALSAPLILMAIQVNNRRLAWASLIAGAIVLYSLLPAKSKITRKLNRSMLIALPIFAIYVSVGWGRTEKIFAPIAAFSSMGVGKIDNSTRARNVENLGMMTMMRQSPLLGTGLGHEWLELDHSYTVPTSVFPLYHYSPHNSVFALLAFYGSLGFAGLWMVLPVSIFFNARSYRVALKPMERSVALTGAIIVVAYLNQAYGDMAAMDNNHMVPATLLGFALASAARLSVLTGAWPTSSTSRLKKGSAKPARA